MGKIQFASFLLINMRSRITVIAFLAAAAAIAAEPVRLQITEVEPVRFERRGEIFFADFGADAYGNVKIGFSINPPAAEFKVRLGEKLAADGTIDRKPGGSVNFREVSLVTHPDKRTYQMEIPSKPFHKRGKSVQMPPEIGEVTPFRYVEIEGAPVALDPSRVRQLFVHAPFDDNASSFESSDETLNAVWHLCKHTMKATTAFGVYIDGERERIPYEADAYINQLSHYACDFDPRLARTTIEYLLKHPTWPTEWSLHIPMMAGADYLATGHIKLASDNYDALKKKLLVEKAREDGLLRAWSIVDWPNTERDGYNDGQLAPQDTRQIGPEINTVVNAFYYHALREMALIAAVLKKDSDARDLEAKAKQVYESFNRVFFDPARGVYLDGEGSTHASLHANMFALAFGLAPDGRKAKVADFVQSRGMACSVYGAQYLMEALFAAGKGDYAVQLMVAKTKRSWWHMIELGSTMTLEAWDPEYKTNLTWNHAWGAAPANIISRFVLGVRPLEPGYKKILIAPQPGLLKWAKGKVPTAVGPVVLTIQNDDIFRLEAELPPGARARVELPLRKGGQVTLDGKSVPVASAGTILIVEDVGPGHHLLESR
ncbi:MAG: alpha-L-rhamnosidase C-terminal domain-containing protein [Luteolibacter sp.]